MRSIGAIRRLVLATMVALIVTIPGAYQSRASVPAQAQAKITVAYPLVGHQDSTTFLSGSGYLPNIKLIFFMACPKWDSPSAAQLQNYGLEAGPQTDSQGDFAGFPFKPPFQLHGVASSGCIIYTFYTNTAFVANLNPQYQIIPASQRLPYDSRHIGGRAIAKPRQVKMGHVVHIAIDQAWGGALARVSVRYPHGQIVTHRLTLDWQGRAVTNIRVPAGANYLGRVQVTASFALGAVRGSTQASFIVLQ